MEEEVFNGDSTGSSEPTLVESHLVDIGQQPKLQELDGKSGSVARAFTRSMVVYKGVTVELDFADKSIQSLIGDHFRDVLREQTGSSLRVKVKKVENDGPNVQTLIFCVYKHELKGRKTIKKEISTGTIIARADELQMNLEISNGKIAEREKVSVEILEQAWGETMMDLRQPGRTGFRISEFAWKLINNY